MKFGVNMLKAVLVVDLFEPVFTAETLSSQSSEDLLIKNSLLRALSASAVNYPSDTVNTVTRPSSHGQ
jgi:hypothetical protein